MLDLEKDFLEIFNGMMGDQSEASWVRNIWREDGGYARGYAALRDARDRLARRLGSEACDDDRDLEQIMGALVDIQEDLCRKMFYYTVQYAQRGYRIHGKKASV